LRDLQVKLKDRMAGIDANLDDLQSGIEACSRGADSLHDDAAGFAQALKRIRNAPVIGSLVKRAAELQACVRDQRGTIQELREAIARLQEELTLSNGAVRPPPQSSMSSMSSMSSAADRSRR
jgi:hypothetical protein